MKLNEIYYEEFLNRAEELEAVEQEIEEKEKEAEEKKLGEFERRKLLEEPYLKKIGTQMQAARLFHPMSELGRAALAAATDTKKAYEEHVGPLIARVPEDSVKRYAPLLSDDIMEDLLVNKMKAIGALRYRDGAVYAAGVLAYGVEPDRAEEDMVLRIHWLYVATEFRGQGIADMLLGSIIAEGLAAGIDYFTFDFQDEKPETQVSDTPYGEEGARHVQNEAYRANIPLQNYDDFLNFYDIKEGDGMYLAPEDRIAVW